MSRFELIPLDVPVLLGRIEAQRRAAAELAKAKYGGVPDWVVHAARWFTSVIETLLDYLGRAPNRSGGVSLVVIISAVLLVAAIGVIVWRVGLPRMRRRTRESEVILDATRSPTSYREQAEEAAAAGDFRGAVGERFRALVRELEERTILDPRPARTATEVAVGAGVLLTGQRSALQRAAAIFSDAWYGDRPVRVDAYHEMAALDTEITAAADRVDLTDPAGADPVPRAGAASGRGGSR